MHISIASLVRNEDTYNIATYINTYRENFFTVSYMENSLLNEKFHRFQLTVLNFDRFS